MIDRRDFMFALGAAAFSVPEAVFAQAKPAVARVGRLSPLSKATDERNREALIDGLRELGWIEGKNLQMEYRFADGHEERHADLAKELAQSGVNVIVAGSTPGALAVKQATSKIPVVIVTTGDPVANGLVKSLAHPGSNVTGVTALTQELGGKRLEVFAEVIPGIKQMAVLANHTSPDTKPSLDGVRSSAKVLGIKLTVLEARDAAGIESAFATLERERAKALMVLQHPMFVTQQKLIVQSAARARLPAMYPLHEFVSAGGLLFYGVDLPEMYRRAATYVDKLLKGAKPGDLPVEQPTKFELVVNMKAATTLGIRFPNSILVRADKVIE